MNKEIVVCVYTLEYYSALEKSLPVATTWMNPEGIALSETSQTQKGKYCMTSLVTWNIKTLNTQKQRVKQWLLGKGRGVKWGDDDQSIQSCSSIG